MSIYRSVEADDPRLGSRPAKRTRGLYVMVIYIFWLFAELMGEYIVAATLKKHGRCTLTHKEVYRAWGDEERNQKAEQWCDQEPASKRMS